MEPGPPRGIGSQQAMPPPHQALGSALARRKLWRQQPQAIAPLPGRRKRLEAALPPGVAPGYGAAARAAAGHGVAAGHSAIVGDATSHWTAPPQEAPGDLWPSGSPQAMAPAMGSP